MMPSWLQKMSRDCARSLRHIRKAGEPMRSLLLSRANAHSYRQSREYAKVGQYTFLLLIQLSYLLTWNISINKNLVLPVPIHHHRRSCVSILIYLTAALCVWLVLSAIIYHWNSLLKELHSCDNAQIRKSICR